MAGDWPDEERRTDDVEDSGRRRRMTDVDLPPSARELERALATHESEAREWRARHDQRLQGVEDRADLLDGRAGNDDGIIGQLGEMRSDLKALREIQKDFRAEVRREIREIKAATSKIDGNTTPPPPKSRRDRIEDILLKFVLPIVLTVIPVVGVIVVGYLQLKGQLIDVQSGGR